MKALGHLQLYSPPMCQCSHRGGEEGLETLIAAYSDVTEDARHDRAPYSGHALYALVWTVWTWAYLALCAVGSFARQIKLN